MVWTERGAPGPAVRSASVDGSRGRPGTTHARRLWLALGIVYVVWGSTYLAIRVAVETLPPFLMAAVRFLLAGGILFAWAAWRGEVAQARLGRRQWAAALLIGGLLLLGGNGGVVWAEQYVPTNVAALIIAIAPIWMALFASRLNRERISRRTVVGLLIGFAGTGLLIQTTGAGGGRAGAVGLAVIVCSSVFWSLGSVLSRRVPLATRPMVATAMEMLCGGALLAVVGVATGELGRVDVDRVSLASLLGLAYLVVFGSLVAFNAYVWLLGNARTAVYSTYAYVNPVVAVFLGWAVLSERVTGLTLVAAALVVGAVVLIMNTESRNRRDRAEPAAPIDAPCLAPPESLPTGHDDKHRP